MSITTSKYGGLAQQLISDGVVSEANMKTAQIESQEQKIGLVPYLVDNKLADSYHLAQMLSQAFGDPLFDLDALSTDVIPKDLVDEKIVRKFNA
ncbi:MAG: type IV-A pilus assembly ATPase PilB, partial [Psychrobacter sp.]